MSDDEIRTLRRSLAHDSKGVGNLHEGAARVRSWRPQDVPARMRQDSRSVRAWRGGAMTPSTLRTLARRYCPRPARWDRLLNDKRAEWGPGHEIAHALLSMPHEWALVNYGLCTPAGCRCPGERCCVVEVAAMYISARLCLAMGRRDPIAAEADATDDYEYIDTQWHWTRAARLLARRRLTRIPRTRRGLERLLRARLA
jgi:hypothetical protein